MIAPYDVNFDKKVEAARQILKKELCDECKQFSGDIARLVLMEVIKIDAESKKEKGV